MQMDIGVATHDTDLYTTASRFNFVEVRKK